MSEENRLAPTDRLRKLVIAQKKAFLPPEEGDPDLVSLHRAVDEYDRLVSEVVIAVIQGLPVNIPEHAILKVQQRIAGLLTSPQVQANRKSESYQRYTSNLDEMIQTARMAVQS